MIRFWNLVSCGLVLIPRVKLPSKASSYSCWMPTPFTSPREGEIRVFRFSSCWWHILVQRFSTLFLVKGPFFLRLNPARPLISQMMVELLRVEQGSLCTPYRHTPADASLNLDTNAIHPGPAKSLNSIGPLSAIWGREIIIFAKSLYLTDPRNQKREIISVIIKYPKPSLFMIYTVSLYT